MPISGSRYFNDPALAAAASNLAGLFAPPSGSDAAGWAAAGAKKAESARLAELFNYAKDPNFDQTQFDRLGVGAGAYTPSQSYYSVDEGNAVTRRGQDVTAQTALSTNAADNARALETNRLSELGNLFDPLAQDAMRPAIPTDIAAQFGVTHGLVAEHGKDSPLSETQLKASILGGMTPEMQEAVTFGSTPIEPIATPAGPRNVLRTDAIGEVPYEKPAGAGMSVTLPDGTVVATGGKSTEAENKAAFAGTMAEGASNDLVKAFDTPGAMPTGTDFQFFNLMRNAPLATHPALVSQMSPQGQKFYQNIRTALPYQLMAKSGLAVTEQEYERSLMELVPVPGEDPGVTAGKRRQFAQFVGVIHGLSGAAWGKAHSNPPIPGPADEAAPKEIVEPGTVPSPTSAAPPQAAIDFLKANPDAAADFDAKYGPGAAARVTGGQ